KPAPRSDPVRTLHNLSSAKMAPPVASWLYFEVFSGSMDRLAAYVKSLSIVMLVAITIWMGFAAAAELCPQVHGPNDYCPVCHLGLIPFLRVSVPIVGALAVLVERLAPHHDFEGDCTDHRFTGISRAPPVDI